MKKQKVLTTSMLSRLSSYCFSACDFNFYVKCYINSWGPLKGLMLIQKTQRQTWVMESKLYKYTLYTVHTVRHSRISGFRVSCHLWVMLTEWMMWYVELPVLFELLNFIVILYLCIYFIIYLVMFWMSVCSWICIS